MKCKSCGANYRTAELRCPYCETENLVGKFWLIKRTETIEKLERQMKAEKKRYVPYVASKILNRMIFFVIVTLIVLAVIDSFSGGSILSTKKNMENLHDAGEYYDLYRYMDKKDNFDDSTPEYLRQSALMARYYNEFLTYRMRYLSDDANKWEPAYVAMVMDDAMHIYSHVIGMYDKEYPENAKQFELYNARILAFWKGTMMCDDSEVEWLADPENVWESGELTELCKKLKARRIAAYGK